MLGLNKDIQPLEAPLTGLGALAAHTEPRRPSVGSLRRAPRGGGRPQQNGDIGGGPYVNHAMNGYTPPQPRRPAPPLGDEPITDVPRYGDNWPITAPLNGPQYLRNPMGYPNDGYLGPVEDEPQYSEPKPLRQSLPVYPDQNSRPHFQDHRPHSHPSPREEPQMKPQMAPAVYTAPPLRDEVPNNIPHNLEDLYKVPRSLKPYQEPEAESLVPHHPSQHPPGAPPEVITTPAPPEVITPYSFPIMLPPDKATAFNISADDLPFMDDEEDDDMYSRRGNLTPPSKVKLGGWRGGGSKV